MISTEAASAYLEALRDAVVQAGFGRLDAQFVQGFGLRNSGEGEVESNEMRDSREQLTFYIDGLKAYFDHFTESRIGELKSGLTELFGQNVSGLYVVPDEERQARSHVRKRKLSLEKLTDSRSIETLLQLVGDLKRRVYEGNDADPPPPDRKIEPQRARNRHRSRSE